MKTIIFSLCTNSPISRMLFLQESFHALVLHTSSSLKLYSCVKLMVFKGLCCRRRGAILNPWPFSRGILVETKWSCRFLDSGWYSFIRLGRQMWVAGLGMFPSQSPHVTQGAVQGINLSWCAKHGRVHSTFCCRVSLYSVTTVSQQHLYTSLLSPQMKDHTQRGARSPGDLTNPICPGGAAFQVGSSQTWLHIMLFSVFCLIHAAAPNSPVSSKREKVWLGFLSLCTQSRASDAFCLMLRCFERLRKVKKMLVWHTCHWY